MVSKKTIYRRFMVFKKAIDGRYKVFKKTIYGGYMVIKKRKLQENGTKKQLARFLYQNSIRLTAEISHVRNH